MNTHIYIFIVLQLHIIIMYNNRLPLDKDSWHHEMFMRGRPDLLLNSNRIIRTSIKGEAEGSNLFKQIPNLNLLPPLERRIDQVVPSKQATSRLQSSSDMRSSSSSQSMNNSSRRTTSTEEYCPPTSLKKQTSITIASTDTFVSNLDDFKHLDNMEKMIMDEKETDTSIYDDNKAIARRVSTESTPEKLSSYYNMMLDPEPLPIEKRVISNNNDIQSCGRHSLDDSFSDLINLVITDPSGQYF